MNEPEREQTLKSASAVYSLLRHIAGAVVGLSALAYLAGWREASAYYSKLGAPWVLSILSTAQIMQQSIELISVVAIFSFLSVLKLLNKASSADSFRHWSIYMMGGATLLYGGGLALKQWLGPGAAYVCSILAGIMWAISAGLTVGELIGRLTETNLRWESRHLWLVYFAVWCGLFVAPDYMGRAQAEIDSNPKLSKLPVVNSSVLPSAGQWRLVSTFSGQALLSQLAEKKEDRRFRIIAITDISEIRSR